MAFDEEFSRKVCNKINSLDLSDPLFFHNKRRNLITFLSCLPYESFDLYKFQRIILDPEIEPYILITIVYLLVENILNLENKQMFFEVDDNPGYTFSDVFFIRSYLFENHFFEQAKERLLTNFFTPEDIDEIAVE